MVSPHKCGPQGENARKRMYTFLEAELPLGKSTRLGRIDDEILQRNTHLKADTRFKRFKDFCTARTSKCQQKSV